MIILLIIELAGVCVLYIAARKKYFDQLELLDKSEDRLRYFLPIGFQLLGLFKHRFSTGYEKKLESRIRELNPSKNARDYLKVHIAKKTVLILFAVIFITFVATQVEIDSAYAIFSIALLGSLFYITDKQLDARIKERRRNIQIEFTEFLNKLILLVNAGLTVPGAIHKIIRDNRKDNPLYGELAITINEISTGKPEIQAYEDFAKRCRLQEVTMFVATLLQNLRKGNSELIPILRLQADNCWDNRKNTSRKLGEEASTKLLIPMIIIFIAILIMVMTPAVFQLNI